jgi:hypothetical protein
MPQSRDSFFLFMFKLLGFVEEKKKKNERKCKDTPGDGIERFP